MSTVDRAGGWKRQGDLGEASAIEWLAGGGACVGPRPLDRLFVHAGDGRRWYIPAAALGGRPAITVAGSKYGEFEIESGRSLPWFSEPPHELQR